MKEDEFMNDIINVNNPIYIKKCMVDNPKEIVIYCHGLGEAKEVMLMHQEVLNNHEIGLIGFDLPSHGLDKSSYKEFTLSNSLSYLDKVISYVKNTHPNAPISLIGDSFGGYVILNYINERETSFSHIFLKYPAVNFFECIMRQIALPENYFDIYDEFKTSEFCLTKDSYLEIKNHDLMKNFDKHSESIYIIHGSLDRAVLVDDVIKFSKNNNIPLHIVDGGYHLLKKNGKEVNEVLMEFMLN